MKIFCRFGVIWSRVFLWYSIIDLLVLIPFVRQIVPLSVPISLIAFAAHTALILYYRRQLGEKLYFRGMSYGDVIVHVFLITLFPSRDIVKDDSLYLRRFFLTPRRLPYRLFLHNIRRPDNDRHRHDHPWPFRTLVLKGGYEEEYVGEVYDGWLTHVKTRTLRVGDYANNKAEHTHLIRKIFGSTWTLLLVKRAHREWGFHTENGWVEWRNYLSLPASTPDYLEDKV